MTHPPIEVENIDLAALRKEMKMRAGDVLIWLGALIACAPTAAILLSTGDLQDHPIVPAKFFTITGGIFGAGAIVSILAIIWNLTEAARQWSAYRRRSSA